MKEKEILSKYDIKRLPPPDNRWWCRVNGITKLSKDRKKLEQKIIKMVSEFQSPSENATIESIFDDYISIRKISVSDSTWANDLKYKRFYLEGSDIFTKPMKKMTPDDAYSFFKHVRKRKAELAKNPSTRVTSDLKRKYWYNLRGFLNRIFDYAIENRYCDYNPFRNMSVHKDAFSPAKNTPKGDAVFSDDEMYSVCALAEKDVDRTNTSLPLGIPLLFQIGARDSELVALKWCDLDGKWLHIQRELAGVADVEGFIRGRCIKPRGKTIKAVRYIECSKDALVLFDRIKTINIQNGYPVGNDDYVFYRVLKGNLSTCTERCFAGRLTKYCKQANMTVIKSPHDARRTCLTNMYKNGVPLSYIQEFAGHETQKQTEEYLKLTIKDLSKASYTSCLNIDTDKLEKFKQVDHQSKVISLKKRA